ncbi:hypothetical protein EVAR_96948_1 [Eumeta japonica]|uniref:Uncharacterized protein n=1 Tax=Eumeta variegata TaxID=151549 RepID=A0A4C1VGV0_EUMVA|nr:hypothetical protein EVAR_96948_1 [Eumeta japonica]
MTTGCLDPDLILNFNAGPALECDPGPTLTSDTDSALNFDSDSALDPYPITCSVGFQLSQIEPAASWLGMHDKTLVPDVVIALITTGSLTDAKPHWAPGST